MLFYSDENPSIENLYPEVFIANVRITLEKVRYIEEMPKETQKQEALRVLSRYSWRLSGNAKNWLYRISGTYRSKTNNGPGYTNPSS